MRVVAIWQCCTPLFCAALFSVVLLCDCNSAGAEEDRIFAGRFASKLRAAIQENFLHIEDADLHNNIVARDLTALLVPKQQPTTGGEVLMSFANTTQLELEEVPLGDVTRLREFAVSGVYYRAEVVRHALAMGRADEIDAAIIQLQGVLREVPDDKRASAQRFAGAILADVEPSKPVLADYVAAYRTGVEADFKKKLESDPRIWTKFSEGLPYAIGSPSPTWIEIAGIKPSNVKESAADGKAYRFTWMGDKFIVVPKLDALPNDTRDPTGLGAIPYLVPRDQGGSIIGVINADPTRAME